MTVSETERIANLLIKHLLGAERIGDNPFLWRRKGDPRHWWTGDPGRSLPRVSVSLFNPCHDYGMGEVLLACSLRGIQVCLKDSLQEVCESIVENLDLESDAQVLERRRTRSLVLQRLREMASRLLVRDREEDPELPLGAIEEVIASGSLSWGDIGAYFATKCEHTALLRQTRRDS